jgi:hypothetical protein
MLSLIIALSSWISMSIILENKSIIPFLVEAIALKTHNTRKAIPTERFAIALITHNIRNAIPTERFAIYRSILLVKKYY